MWFTMDKIIRALIDIRDIKLKVDDDTADRLSRQYTPSILVMFAALVSARQYMGDPIHCWCPEQCASNHEKYANIYCWVGDTYHVAPDEPMPQGTEEPKRRITYYQWVPLVLIGQAVMFHLPAMLWRFLHRRSGINIGILMEATVASQRAVYAETREKTMRYTVQLIDKYLLVQRDHRSGCLVRIKHALSKHCFIMFGKFTGNYLLFSYLLVKLIYLGNAVGQLFLLDVVLGYKFHLFGLHVARHLLTGDEWDQSRRFPRVTLCDFNIRQNTNVHRYTYQCVLPINLFNEKIFILIWFWYFFVGIVTALSLLHWFRKSVYWPSQVSYIKRHLRAMDTVQRETILIRKFTENYLRRDGLFILRLIAKNAGDLISMELLCGLWENYGPRSRLMTESFKRAGDKAKNGGTPTAGSVKLEVV